MTRRRVGTQPRLMSRLKQRDEETAGETEEDDFQDEVEAAEPVQPRVAPLRAGEHEAELRGGGVGAVETFDGSLERRPLPRRVWFGDWAVCLVICRLIDGGLDAGVPVAAARSE